jgi:geranylgeranyl diphosphate synthase type I
MSASPQECAAVLKRMSLLVDAELARLLQSYEHNPASRMYNMLRYFLGYIDSDFNPAHEEAGKRFRPSLTLLLAEGYDVRDTVLPAAVAIELFHNFTLIHDDVEDNDAFRRNRPTVWKVWGVNHAINAGDAQSLLSTEWALRAAEVAKNPALGQTLLATFREVIEGQYLDFELTNAPLTATNVTEAGYLQMIEKKSGALVRVAAEVAGIVAGKSEKEIALLRDYGTYLGMAYQMGDDYRSVWTSQDITGKDTHSDIREHKRTLPFLYARTEAKEAARLDALYALDRPLTDSETEEAISILTTTSASRKLERLIYEYATRAKAAVVGLGLPAESKDLLEGMVDMLVPEGRTNGTAPVEHPSIALT